MTELIQPKYPIVPRGLVFDHARDQIKKEAERHDVTLNTLSLNVATEMHLVAKHTGKEVLYESVLYAYDVQCGLIAALPEYKSRAGVCQRYVDIVVALMDRGEMASSINQFLVMLLAYASAEVLKRGFSCKHYDWAYHALRQSSRDTIREEGRMVLEPYLGRMPYSPDPDTAERVVNLVLMASRIDYDGEIRVSPEPSKYNLKGTATGRLDSKEPNPSNTPKASTLGEIIREKLAETAAKQAREPRVDEIIQKGMIRAAGKSPDYTQVGMLPTDCFVITNIPTPEEVAVMSKLKAPAPPFREEEFRSTGLIAAFGLAHEDTRFRTPPRQIKGDRPKVTLCLDRINTPQAKDRLDRLKRAIEDDMPNTWTDDKSAWDKFSRRVRELMLRGVVRREPEYLRLSVFDDIDAKYKDTHGVTLVITAGKSSEDIAEIYTELRRYLLDNL